MKTDRFLTRRDVLRIAGSALTACATSRLAAAMPDTTLSMMSRTIPSSGEPLPAIGLGTWQTFDVGAAAAQRAPLKEVLAEFVRLGGKLIDSSPMYGKSEEVAGDLAAE